MNRGNSVYLRHIYDSICRIEQYTISMVFDSFINNVLVQAAVIRELEIIGEATKRISMDIRDKYPEIPWKVMAGTRDKLIHHYFGVDIQVVWDTVDKAIPQLKAKIEKVFEREGIG